MHILVTGRHHLDTIAIPFVSNDPGIAPMLTAAFTRRYDAFVGGVAQFIEDVLADGQIVLRTEPRLWNLPPEASVMSARETGPQCSCAMAKFNSRKLNSVCALDAQLRHSGHRVTSLLQKGKTATLLADVDLHQSDCSMSGGAHLAPPPHC